MSSERKLRSARENGARARGRKSPEGIARSAMNALKHGLTAELILLPNESESDFEDLRGAYLREFQPASPSAADLVEELVAARWRMRRVWAIETRLLNVEILKQREEVERDFEAIDDETRTALAFKALCDHSGALALLDRYEARLRRTIDRILRAFQPRPENLPNDPNPETGHPPQTPPEPPKPPEVRPTPEPATLAGLLDRRTFLGGIASAALGRLVPAPLPVFRDVTAASRIGFRCDGSPTSQKYLIETMVGGVAMFDYDGDGRLDLYFVNGAALGDPQPAGKPPDKSDPRFWNRLYHNNGDGTFSDVTERAGVRGHSYGMGVATGDYDNDGRPDLYVTNFGRNILYHNNGDGTFTDVTEKAGVEGGGWSSSACFVDYDRDGWLDLVVTRYLEWDFAGNPWCGPRQPPQRGYCHPGEFKRVGHLVFHNNRNGTFTDVSKGCGLGAVPGYGLGIAVNDYDGDGWPDVLIANDNVPEQLFHNLRNGRFEEVALKTGLAYDEDGHTFSGMGADFNDYDNDGWPDVFIGALANEKYALFRNRKGAFQYVSGPSGVGTITARHSGWGLKFIDYDNDGWKDLLVAQGHVMDNIDTTSPPLRYLEPLLLMRNNGGTFEDVSKSAGEPFRIPRAARGVAFGDLDNDGSIDVAINCLNGPAVILHNEGGTGNHWLLINTVGTASNRDGIGAKLRLVSGSGREQYGYVSTAGSYQSANDKRVHFGLGPERTIKLLEITWPSGTVQALENVAADQVLTVREPARK